MLKTTKLDEEQSQYISMITRGAERVNELINNLLLSEQIAKPRSGFHSLHQLLEEVLIMAKDRILLKKVAVCREYAATEHILLLDKEKIKIALTNIVINAIDAMPSEGGELKLTTKSIGGQTSIEIQDNGKGISKGNLARIFEPYFTNKPGGMGLGLSATLDILRANHASVDVRSEEGRGTCFMLSFCGK
jgi:signal transduction histidine kinase